MAEFDIYRKQAMITAFQDDLKVYLDRGEIALGGSGVHAQYSVRIYLTPDETRSLIKALEKQVKV